MRDGTAVETTHGILVPANAVGFAPRRSTDPSLRSQLAQRSNLVDSERVKAYLEACAKAPDASEGTKRKWKVALFGKPVST